MILSTVVVQNLMYLAGAVVLAIIGVLIVVLRHRRPQSVEANMASFHKGLQALSPERGSRQAARPATVRVTTPSSTVRSVAPPPATAREADAG